MVLSLANVIPNGFIACDGYGLMEVTLQASCRVDCPSLDSVSPFIVSVID